MTAIIAIFAAILLGIGVFAWRFIPATARLPLAAALALGLAGYAWQGHPALPGAPVRPAAEMQTSGEPIDKPLMGMVRNLDRSTNWLMLSDSLARRGDTEQAAQLLAKAVKTYPQSADLWVGYGAALIAHADGRSTRASEMIMAEARRRSPTHPGPDFYEGIAKVREGDLDGADKLWTRAYNGSSGDAEWRQDLAMRLNLVRALIAQRAETGDNPQ
ncbi:MAG: tetratricopeptide repeat protein [Sphingomonadales bacterium]|nr:tetratricopeptide repeat protein [Sphingomonadales bacterium]